MRAEVLIDGQPLLMEAHQLEESVRRGEISMDAPVRLEQQSPWVPLASLEQFAQATNSVAARLLYRLQTRYFPVFPLLMAIAMLAGMLVDARRLATGQEAFWLDQRWWTLWTAPFGHMSWAHLVANLPIVLYCGWRVERLLKHSVWLVVAGAMLGGGLGILLVGAKSVVGASGLAYGLCGAQVALGLRFGEQIPRGHRGFYGKGNLIFCLPLLLVTLGQSGVSDAAHLGGFFGGFLMALVAPLSGVMPVVGGGLVLALGFGLAFLPQKPVLEEIPGTGLKLGVPSMLVGQPTLLGGVAAWGEKSPVFGEVAWSSRERESGTSWARRLGGRLIGVEAVEPLEAGWRGVRLRLRVEGRDLFVVEQEKARGELKLRVGYLVPVNASRARIAAYERAIRAVEIGEPPDLVAARVAWEKEPQDPGRLYAYLVEQVRIGEGDRGLIERLERWPGWEERAKALQATKNAERQRTQR
jgi:membrane associated rhomboid family serine protease